MTPKPNEYGSLETAAAAGSAGTDNQVPAYLVVSVKATGNLEELARYREAVEATVAPFGGRYLARCNDPQVLEGAWSDDQIVIVAFPNTQAAQDWNNSDAYQSIAPWRTNNTHSTRLLVTGRPTTPQS